MAETANEVWVVLQQREGALHPMSREAVAAGAALAGAVGAEARAVILGAGASGAAGEAAAYGVDVQIVEHEVLGDYTPGAWVDALCSLAGEAPPRWWVLPHSYQSVDFMARLAQRLDAALVPEAVGFTPGDRGIVWLRPVFGGKLQAEVRVKGEGPVIVSVQSGAFQAEKAELPGSVTTAELDGSGWSRDREVLGVEEVAGEHVDLSQAKVIVAVGRGIGDADNIEKVRELAAELGAELGASRPVVDSGWLERDRQIGSSGQTVTPKLYLAVGISGAIQHLVGMKGSQCVVAINKDPEAPIFALSRYGVVGDLHEIVPALTEALREARG